MWLQSENHNQIVVEDFLKAENYAIQDRNNSFQKREYFGGLGPIFPFSQILLILDFFAISSEKIITR